MRAGLDPKRCSGGFTLVEMLIALVLLAMLMVILVGAMRTMGKVEDRVEHRIAVLESDRIAADFLRTTLSRVSGRTHRGENLGQAAQIPFYEAGPDSLSWIGVMPARFGLGGRHYMHLSLENEKLVLRYAPWTGHDVFSDWSQATVRVLAAPVDGLSLQYQEPVSGMWSPVWPPAGMNPRDLPRSGLPAAIWLQLDGPAPAWPPVVATLQPTGVSGIQRAVGAFGGSGG